MPSWQGLHWQIQVSNTYLDCVQLSQLMGFCSLKIYFLKVKFQLYAYTHLKNENQIKNSSKGVRDSTERPKIGLKGCRKN